MANGFTKFFSYLSALFSSKVDEHADPKVQIQQAIEDAQRQHQQLSQQAAAVIGNQRQLEMKLNRQLGEIEKLQSSARQALVLADQARASGDEQKAQQYEQAAQATATQLVTAEQNVEDLKTLHDQSIGAAEQAKKAVERNSMMLQQKIGERTKLLSQLEQAKMQEQAAKSLQSMSELTAPGNAPSLDEVRDKIEKRYANALGAGRPRAELGAGPDARGPAGDHRHGRRQPPGPDPRVDGGPPGRGRGRAGRDPADPGRAAVRTRPRRRTRSRRSSSPAPS